MQDCVRVLLLVTVVMVSGKAIAADEAELTVVPGIDLAYKQSSLNLIKNGVAEEGVKPNYIAVIPSLLLAYGKFYTAISYDTPLTEHHTVLIERKSATEIVYTDRSYTRQEATLTMGYRVLPSLSLFAGYIRGETKIRVMDNRYDSSNNVSKPEPNSIGFEAQGYFAGLSTSRVFENKGTLAFSIAYAVQNGTMRRDDFKGAIENFVTRSATGFSTSISWSGQMSESVLYQVGYRYAKYFYDFELLSIEEPVQGLTFGLRKYF